MIASSQNSIAYQQKICKFMKLCYKQLIYKHIIFAHSREVRSLAGSISKSQFRTMLNVCGVTSNILQKL